jgi:hypothetical protein
MLPCVELRCMLHAVLCCALSRHTGMRPCTAALRCMLRAVLCSVEAHSRATLRCDVPYAARCAVLCCALSRHRFCPCGVSPARVSTWCTPGLYGWAWEVHAAQCADLHSTTHQAGVERCSLPWHHAGLKRGHATRKVCASTICKAPNPTSSRVPHSAGASKVHACRPG